MGDFKFGPQHALINRLAQGPREPSVGPGGEQGWTIPCEECGKQFGCFGPSPTIRGLCDECARKPGPPCRACGKVPDPGMRWLGGMCSDACRNKHWEQNYEPDDEPDGVY